MSISDALLVAVLCFSFVFAVLASLFFLIKLFSFGITSLEKKEGAIGK